MSQETVVLIVLKDELDGFLSILQAMLYEFIL